MKRTNYPLHFRAASALALAVLCVLVYLPALNGPFLFDDHYNIDPARIDKLSVETLTRAALSNYSGMLGRPIPALSFALNDYFGSDGGTFAFKATNLALHLVNGVLIFLLARIVFATRESERRSNLLAAIVCAIWLLHPLQVSTVMYTVQRMAQLAALFSVISLLCYLQARRCGDEKRGACIAWLCGAVLAALAACFSKESGALVPLFVLTLEATVLRARRVTGPGVWVRRLGVHGSLASTAILALALASLAPEFADAYSGRDFGLLERLHAQLHALVRYLGWIVIPDTTSMTFFYDAFAAPAKFGIRSLLAAGSLMLLLGYAIATRKTRPIEAFGILLFLTAHCLESTLIPLELMFEHRNYLALAGIAISGVAVVSRTVPVHAARRAGLIATVSVIGILTLMTFQRATLWADHTAIAFEATLNTPTSERAWIELAYALAFQGNEELSKSTFHEALQALPDNAHLELQRLRAGMLYGWETRALLHSARSALHSGPLTLPAVSVLMAISDGLERGTDDPELIGEVASLFDAALASEEMRLNIAGEAMFHYHHHRFLLEDGRVNDAVNAIRRTTVLAPEKGEAWMRLAETLVLVGQAPAAEQALNKAIGFSDASSLERIDSLKHRIDVMATIE